MPEVVAVGRIVHFVMPNATDYVPDPEVGSKQVPAHRPAIIVRVWDKNTGTVQLQVFTDSSNDGADGGSGVVWQTSVPYSETHEPRTWHFPVRDE